MGVREDAAAHLASIGIGHASDLLVPDNCFVDPGEQDRFAQAVLDRAPADLHAYEALCGGFSGRGAPVAPGTLPPAVVHVTRTDLLESAGEEATDERMEENRIQLRGAARAAKGAWLPLAQFVPPGPGLPLTSRHCVFVTFRPEDPQPGAATDPRVVRDALSTRPFCRPLGAGWGAARRLNHRLALGHALLDRLAVLWYDRGCFREYRVPVAPDGGTHEAFRPAPPGSACGWTHPEYTDEGCRDPGGCHERELVHEPGRLGASDPAWVKIIEEAP
jgi:hypothetical protein